MNSKTHAYLMLLFVLIAVCQVLGDGGFNGHSVVMAILAGANTAVAKLTPSKSETNKV